MRITFNNADSFLAELTKDSLTVWEKQVRYRIDATTEQQEAVSFSVSLTLTAVIDLEPRGQYILEAVIACGCDDKDLEPPDAGTRMGMQIMEQVHTIAKACGLEVREGKIETF